MGVGTPQYGCHIQRSPRDLTVKGKSTTTDANLVSIAQSMLLNTLSIDEGAVGTV
jgi:hypothetical protein